MERTNRLLRRLKAKGLQVLKMLTSKKYEWVVTASAISGGLYKAIEIGEGSEYVDVIQAIDSEGGCIALVVNEDDKELVAVHYTAVHISVSFDDDTGQYYSHKIGYSEEYIRELLQGI